MLAAPGPERATADVVTLEVTLLPPAAAIGVDSGPAFAVAAVVDAFSSRSASPSSATESRTSAMI